MSKTVLITGISGQTGSYLAELLLKRGYEVHGLVRRLSVPNLTNIESILSSIHLIEGDLMDQGSLDTAVRKIKPDEVYNLAAQSFVATSWTQPILTHEITALGAVRTFEAVRNNCPDAKIYQASSSEQFGNSPAPQNENTPFKPRSPYGCAKVFAHNCAVNYRESYGMFISCGICFNHESPRRGIEFVTRKITDGVAKIKLGKAKYIEMGNLDAKRDWGFAGDFCFVDDTSILVKNPDNSYHKTGSMRIKDVNIGDYVLTFNEKTSKKEWNKVTNCFKRQSNDVYKVTLSNDNYILVTGTHPIAVVNDSKIEWKQVDNLNIQDKLIQKKHFSVTLRINNLRNQGKTNIDRFGKEKAESISDKISKRLNGVSYEERYGEKSLDVKQKLSLSSKQMWDKEGFKEEYIKNNSGINNHNYRHGKTFIPEFCKICGVKIGAVYFNKSGLCRSCVASDLWKNESYRDKVVKEWHNSLDRQPNKPEQILIDILDEYFHKEFKYVRNGEVVINGYIPDFININGKHKIIEFFGSYWHNKSDVAKRDDLKLETYRKKGYDVLIIRDDDLKNIDPLITKIGTFIFNPDIEIVTVKRLEKQNGEFTVYNIKTENNHNYFANGILSHNCNAMWHMLQLDKPDDFVIATRECHTVKEFVEKALECAGLEPDVEKYVRINPKFIRPAEVNELRGDYSKANKAFGWSPKVKFEKLVKIMVENDIHLNRERD